MTTTVSIETEAVPVDLTTPWDTVLDAVSIRADAGLQEIVDAVEGGPATLLSVVDGTGRVIGTIDADLLPALFSTRGPRVAGTARHRRRHDRLATATARDLMTPLG